MLDLKFTRIQFTPDLMPADIIGTNIIMRNAGRQARLQFQPGPIFAQIVLADEINRATPKTQSALLEAMQEHTVTVGGTIHQLKEPFFVMATQNPIEQEGTYPLPEAQLDRFFFKLVVGYSGRAGDGDDPRPHDAGRMPQAGQGDGRRARFASGSSWFARCWSRRRCRITPSGWCWRRIRRASSPRPTPISYIRCGASPRGAQALVLAAKVRALLDGRYNVSFEDIRRVYLPALRHRVLLNFEAQAENISTDEVLATILNDVKEKAEVR